MPAPRDVVGTAVVDGDHVVAAASPWATRAAGEVDGRRRWPGRPVRRASSSAPASGSQLVPGRNHFGEPAAPVYGVRCRDDLVDPTGQPLRVRAHARSTTRLEVTVERVRARRWRVSARSRATRTRTYGVAFELADVDRDGTPEVIVSGAGAPGDPDAVKVVTLGGDEKKALFRRQFNGGVAGVAVLDGDGDGAPEVIAAVRLVGATRVDLWRLD